jgi:hypothetical protein
MVKIGIVLPQWLLTYPDLSYAAKVACALVLHYTQGKAGTMINLSDLVAKMGDEEEKITGYLEELERRGLIQKCVNGRVGAGGQKNFSRKGAKGQRQDIDAPKRKEPLSRYDYDVCLELAHKIAENRDDIRSVRSLAGHFYWTGLNDEEIATMLLSEGRHGPGEEKAIDIFSHRRN